MKFSFGINAYDTARNQFDQKYRVPIDQIDCMWGEFVDLLTDCTQVPRPATDAAKNSAPWVAPFLLKSGADSRRKEDVDRMACWIGLDLDMGNWSASQIAGKLAGSGYIAWTTTKSVPDAQRWRVIVSLDREYTISEHDRVWRWFNDRFERQLDPATRNYNRIFYVPAMWDGGDNLFINHYARAASVDNILSMVAPVEQIEPLTSYVGDLVAAPDGTPIITEFMLMRAMQSAKGRRFYRLMVEAAKRFMLNGWTLSARDLTTAALHAADAFSPGQARPHAAREAQRALDWVAANVRPLTPMEKLRNRVLWEQHRAELRKAQ